jgi:glycosyltransferase involved in cell wall biosynthesis
MGPNSPVISVLMTVCNGGRYLLEAVESILRQSFGDFEFLIVDDGSSDSTPQILRDLRDPRIVTYKNDVNLGIPKSLNRILPLARGRYVTRMDCDDISVLNRFAVQVSYLEAHPEIGLLGSACLLIDSEGSKKGLMTGPSTDLEIRWKMLLTNPFVQSSVCLRRDVVEQEGIRYDERFAASQDYDLWTRMLVRTRGCNLPEPVVKYRVHGKGITGQKRDEQLRNHDLIAFQAIRRTLSDFCVTLEEISELRRFLVGTYPSEGELSVAPVILLERYAKLLAAFVARYSHEANIRDLRRTEANAIASRLRGQPLGLRWLKVAGKVLALEPALMGEAARRGIGGLLCRPGGPSGQNHPSGLFL